MTQSVQSPVVVRRSYSHPQPRVFDAFAHARALESWLAPASAIRCEVLAFDFVVGGHYRIRFTLADGTQTVLGGQYKSIEPPQALRFSWMWEAPDPHAGIESEVTITLERQGAGTRLTICHERLSAEGMPDRHASGWQGTLERLEDFLGLQQSPLSQLKGSP